ncbi:PREDICTED: protein BREAST CANCER SUSCEPTIBILITY 1 homolog [Nelumbo nucifera]|uniref:Protein BREAST CANCER SUSCEPTIBILITY 1 homolog n=2 Tax=Nelumbo nucifera TaxID=4432 RepID=A0A1U8B4S8_NELNU|nr:PREDICTED: protein BREAST CANCER SUSCEPTIBILITY 1 homolog [Nelumbo nucifera]DAD33929.1 TPA_asm: hypothetical protein HUJ06_012780 [Nelumbo nucifera]
MADFSHLEKMGRELKCPICLSLLNSAVSLTCNHVFCNSCIVKSMKSVSSCPVCKVPYRRREIRPAPNMDSLVSIYKSMEIASGMNIFVTQAVPSTKASDGQDQLEGENNSGGVKTAEASINPKKKKKSNAKNTKELLKAGARVPDSMVKPSFSGKKRVQVPPHLPFDPSETPIRPEKSGVLSKSTEKGPKEDSILLPEKPAFNEKGEPMFPPFFWVREGDDNDGCIEKLSSQQMEGDHTQDTLGKAPCFSDIKDSDDQSPIKMINTGEVCSATKFTDAFDSEMFEWTQRACSPELCSTPMKQDVDKSELDEIQEDESDAFQHIWSRPSKADDPVSENVEGVNVNHRTSNTDVELPNLYSKIKTASDQSMRNNSTRRDKGTNEGALCKHVRKTMDEVMEGVPVISNKNENALSQAYKVDDGNSLNLVGKTFKRNKKNSSDAINMTKVLDTFISIEENQGSKNMDVELPVSLREKSKNNKNLNLKNKDGKSGSNINAQCQNDRPKRSKCQKADISVTKVLKELPTNQNPGNKSIGTQFLASSSLENNVVALGFGEKSSGRSRKIKTHPLRENVRKRLKVSTNSSLQKLFEVPHSSKEAAEKGTRASSDEVNFENGTADNQVRTEGALCAAKDMFLQKCESIPDRICCAFCHCSEDSEASGEMLHYFNGRPVAADYNGGSNVIHSHKNCTEWAPNIYFEDDTAINLEAELARSRRIKCCCCGIKGAALGCYEKSCRKSFHVPCAKLVQQCRWDTENFVILCPLHSSSKLPNEFSRPQGLKRKRSKRSILKGESHARQAEVVIKHSSTTRQPWRHLGCSNWLICCSALTVAEKEIVSEFAKLAGVSVSKTWRSNVTHVIASTDENGACKRTFKVLMGILEGKWILKIDWIIACMKAMEPVDKEQYEINVDIHGVRDGPRLGRLRVLNKHPKLFNGFMFYFTGEFMPSYKGYLQDLVVAAGGTVLQRKPISRDQERLLCGSSKSEIFIIYSVDLPDKCDPGKKTMICNRRRSDAEVLANSTGAKVASSAWILDSIAGCKCRNFYNKRLLF